jgi:hypothetical protein
MTRKPVKLLGQHHDGTHTWDNMIRLESAEHVSTVADRRLLGGATAEMSGIDDNAVVATARRRRARRSTWRLGLHGKGRGFVCITIYVMYIWTISNKYYSIK